jgi:hypothetical protein
MKEVSSGNINLYLIREKHAAAMFLSKTKTEFGNNNPIF